VIELLVLQALAHEASGQSDEALASWEQAVQLGEPEGYVRVFEEAGAMGWSHVGGPGISTDTGSTTQELTDPLSSRELDVLRYLGSELDGPAIARELGVSLATVRTHTQHIYTKLGVNNRRAAVRRAHQLNLFSRSTR
jgi:LuxR family maltose regulon positive regulatory protein